RKRDGLEWKSEDYIEYEFRSRYYDAEDERVVRKSTLEFLGYDSSTFEFDYIEPGAAMRIRTRITCTPWIDYTKLYILTCWSDAISFRLLDPLLGLVTARTRLLPL